MAGGSADRLNNVENVYVFAAAAGTWTITVSGYNVPQGPQPFALVVDATVPGGRRLPMVRVTVDDGDRDRGRADRRRAAIHAHAATPARRSKWRTASAAPRPPAATTWRCRDS